jgi:hypothetical protein
VSASDVAGSAMRRRILVLADQGASSLSNIVVVVLVAQAATPDLLGRFVLSMAAYQLAVGAVRSLVGEPLLSLYSQEPAEARRRVVSELLGTTLWLGVVGSLVLWPVALFLGGPTGSGLAALAWVLPLVMVQDTWRYVFIIDRPGAALAIDLVWLVAVVLAVPLMPADASVGRYVLVWGLAGGLGGLVGVALGGLPRLVRPWKWLVDNRAMTWRYLADFTAARGTSQATLIALPAISGPAALGAVRAAQVFYGFLNVAHSGLYLALVPEGARQRAEPRRLRWMFVRASAVGASLPLTWMVIGQVLPDKAGRWLFSETWNEASELLVPMGLTLTVGGVLGGALLGMRAVGDARLNLRARVYCTPFQLLCPVVGAVVGDGLGFVIGAGVGTSITTVIWWTLFARATAGPSPVDPVPAAPVDGILEHGMR